MVSPFGVVVGTGVFPTGSLARADLLGVSDRIVCRFAGICRNLEFVPYMRRDGAAVRCSTMS
jgi:hypothetical protein